jgi:DNA-binding transcriptional LysR family regulator
LKAFVVAAHELHFARAAERIYISPSSMSEIIRRLELELGTALFARTTRRISLTDAGAELLQRAEEILELVDQATSAVRATAEGTSGRIIVGVTPPAAPVLAPHLAREFASASPDVLVEIRRLWLPDLSSALLAGAVDVAITCATLATDSPAIGTAEIGSEPLLIGVRSEHPLAALRSIDLRLLADQTLGIHAAHLFPAWHAAQREILLEAGLTPPMAELHDADLTARGWTHQTEIDWIMLIGSFLGGQEQTTVRPAGPAQSVPFTICWKAGAGARPLVQRFVQSSLDAGLPANWIRPTGSSSPNVH